MKINKLKQLNSTIFIDQYAGSKKSLYRKNAVLYNVFRSFENHRLNKVAEFIPNKKNYVLEIGCSDGLFLYQNRSKWREIRGIDVVPKLLNQAKKRRYDVPVRFELADYGRSKMPYPSATFNLVISISVLQYLYDLDLFYKEVYRVLQKGGQFIFEVPNAASFWRRIQFLFGRIPRTSQFDQGWDAGVIHYFTKYELEKYATKFGFSVKKISCSGIFDSLRSVYPSLLGGDLIFVLEK